MIINCAIVDDESLARRLIEEHISKIPYLKVVASVKSPFLLNQALSNEKVDILFMDIQMPDIKGTSYVKAMQNQPLVVFTTAYPEYAIEGFDLDAIDYLVKPIPFERFLQAIQKAEKHLKTVETKTVQISKPTDSTKEAITVKADHKIYKIKYEDILYIEGLKEYVSFYLHDGKRIISLESLKKLEESLPNTFIRIHKSYIVNLKHVTVLEGNMAFIGTKDLPIGGSYKESFLNRFKE